ncbi:hypothetical protein DUNSADRAFT_3127 [Dunaliella salina]|uniref:Secreted protein n=1 Tax=Dunaliella salina TaxID=3046 RepID=A0ABQ7H822_DUNSA|nr:hypothetical protein DUNSADRAFT_3127 [Dunaliella salina]|eukprot:KAF5842998.1 hypothetical protein DUNSADRAFT_3127 [Dunaliella salina]
MESTLTCALWQSVSSIMTESILTCALWGSVSSVMTEYTSAAPRSSNACHGEHPTCALWRSVLIIMTELQQLWQLGSCSSAVQVPFGAQKEKLFHLSSCGCEEVLRSALLSSPGDTGSPFCGLCFSDHLIT